MTAAETTKDAATAMPPPRSRLPAVVSSDNALTNNGGISSASNNAIMTMGPPPPRCRASGTSRQSPSPTPPVSAARSDVAASETAPPPLDIIAAIAAPRQSLADSLRTTEPKPVPHTTVPATITSGAPGIAAAKGEAEAKGGWLPLLAAARKEKEAAMSECERALKALLEAAGLPPPPQPLVSSPLPVLPLSPRLPQIDSPRMIESPMSTRVQMQSPSANETVVARNIAASLKQAMADKDSALKECEDAMAALLQQCWAGIGNNDSPAHLSILGPSASPRSKS